jgi:choline dehydrogenase-like flavoprotein
MQETPLELFSPGEIVRCGYLVIGSGAGGSVAAWELARAGKDVVVVEEGGDHSTASFTAGVGELTRKLYRLGGVTPFFGKPTVGFAEARCLGGGTVINGGLLWRAPEWILDEWEKDENLRGYGVRDLAPHFEQVERLLEVRDANDMGGNRDSEVLAQAGKSLGWKVVPARRALTACKNTNRCPTGCPTGAKKATTLNYLAEARTRGARILPETRITRLIVEGSRIREAVGMHRGRPIRFQAERYFLAGGPVHTPHLLRRSSLSREAGRRMRFHLNLKFVATFDTPIRAAKGTIFTEQVQEYERQGLYMMASNWLPHYAAATLTHLGPQVVESVLRDFDKSALYVAQVRSRGFARIFSALDSPVVWQSLAREDMESIRFAFEKMGQILFEAGARRVYLPIQGEPPVESPAALREAVRSLTPKRLELISVHAMASCPMSGHADRGVVDCDGRLRGVANVWLCDASVLPDNLGESPQGTIMAFAHQILSRHLAACA